MEYGIIKMVDTIKQFGFIVGEDEEEYYFSFQDIHPKWRNQPFREGDRVGFDIRHDMRGDRAVNIRKLS
jgi:cold shock CspA family protein